MARGLAAVDSQWEEAFFGLGLPAPRSMRRHAASALTNVRASLVPLHMATPLPPIAWQVEAPASVADRHGHRLGCPRQAFSDLFDPSMVEPSRGFLSRHGIEGWVRFPYGGDPGPGWARRPSHPPLFRTGASSAMPSFVFTHGIAMETEFAGNGRNTLARWWRPASA